MKRTLLLMAALAAVTFSCERELPQPVKPMTHVQASSSDGLPSYTLSKYQTLLAAQTDEADMVEKSRLLAYTLARYLGEHASALDITDAGGVESVLPCDQTWLGNDGILRTIGTATGQTDEAVKADLSAIIDSRIDGDLPPAEQALLLDGLLSSLVHQGQAYTTRNHYPAVDPATGEVIFVSYGVSYRAEGYQALGYRWALTTGQLTYAELPIAEAMAEGVLLLDLIEIDPGAARYNDPCHQGPVYGGGGSSGGGGGSSNLDDDGSQKGYLNDPLITGNGVCTNWSGPTFGLRVAEFHLADRNEGGLFSGKSEVYAMVTAYNSGNPTTTYKTNENGVTKSLQGYQYRRGIQLDEVPASTVSGTTQTIRTANGRNWNLLGGGICPSGGFDRFIITLFEYDGPAAPRVQDNFIDLPNIYWGDYHWPEMTMESDIWYTNRTSSALTLDQLNQNGGFLYLAETASGYTTTLTQPSAQRSWFKIELF